MREVGERLPKKRLSRRAIAVLAGAALSLATVGCDNGNSTQGPQDGCSPYTVYAQNRWDPIGASARAEPDVKAEKIGSFAGNEVVTVDGWKDTGIAAYPTNPELWQGGTWLRLAQQIDGRTGWVTTAAVRARPTSRDPTGYSPDGGIPAPTPEECELE